MDTDQSNATQSYSITDLGYKGGKHVYAASLVCLINVGQAALNEIKPKTPFGDKFFQLVGTSVQEFLTNLKDTYENFHMENPHSLDHRASDDVWFSERPMRGHIRGGNTPLSKASLIIIMTALVAQLRQRASNLEKARLQSEFTSGLKDALENCLKMIPVQKEKTLLVRRRKEEMDEEKNQLDEKDTPREDKGKESGDENEDDDKSEMRTISVLYEPFVDQIAGAFSEASKTQRIATNKSRETREQEKQKDKESGWKIKDKKKYKK